MRPHREVHELFLTEAPAKAQLFQDIPASPSALFRCLEDAEAWTRWLGLDEVTWTSPLGPGATRTVRKGRVTIDEHFFAWEPGEVMAFRFDRSSLPLTAAAEEYRVVDRGDGTCQLRWTFACDATLTPVAHATAFTTRRLFDRSLPRLATLLRDDSARDEEG